MMKYNGKSERMRPIFTDLGGCGGGYQMTLKQAERLEQKYV